MKRRNFIKFAGAAAGSGLLPISSLLASNVMAQTSGNNSKKLLCIFTPNGVPTDENIEYWHPAPGTVNLRPASARLEKYKHDCLFLDGIQMYGAINNSHDGGNRAVLTANGNDSLDVAVGEYFNRNGETPYNSLQMGPYCRRGNQGNPSFKDGFPIPFEDKCVSLYQKLWGAAPSESAGKDFGVLSLINEDLTILRKRLGSIEKEKLEQHTDTLSDLERRLTRLAQQSNTDKPIIHFGSVTDSDVHSTHNFYETSAVMQDIAVAALSMGLTRSLNFAFGCRTFGGEVDGINDHSASHTGGDTHVKNRSVWSDETRKLFDRMKNTPNGSSNLFDNTLSFHYSEIGSGSDHWFFRMPFFLAGGKNWGLNSGNTLRYSQGYGVPHHKLLTTIALRAGMPIDHFGDGHEGLREGKGFGTGPFTDIFS